MAHFVGARDIITTGKITGRVNRQITAARRLLLPVYTVPVPSPTYRACLSFDHGEAEDSHRRPDPIVTICLISGCLLLILLITGEHVHVYSNWNRTWRVNIRLFFSPSWVLIPIFPRRSMRLASAHSILTVVTSIHQRQFLPRVTPPVHHESQYATPLENLFFRARFEFLCQAGCVYLRSKIEPEAPKFLSAVAYPARKKSCRHFANVGRYDGWSTHPRCWGAITQLRSCFFFCGCSCA